MRHVINNGTFVRSINTMPIEAVHQVNFVPFPTLLNAQVGSLTAKQVQKRGGIMAGLGLVGEAPPPAVSSTLDCYLGSAYLSLYIDKNPSIFPS